MVIIPVGWLYNFVNELIKGFFNIKKLIISWFWVLDNLFIENKMIRIIIVIILKMITFVDRKNISFDASLVT